MISVRGGYVIWKSSGLFVVFLLLLIPLSMLVMDISFDYTLQTVMMGAGILGLVSGVLGSFAVLRKQSLMGDTLAHAALPGVAIAFLLAGRELSWLLVGAAVTGLLSILFIQAVTNTTRIKQDTAMGIALSVMFGFGVAMLGYIQGREDASRAGLNTFIFGQAAAIDRDDVLLIGTLTFVVVAIITFFWKEFKLLTFDAAYARTNGFPVQVLDIMLSSLIVVGIVLGLQLAGVILMVGMLIAPAVAARQWTNSLGEMVILAAVLGAISGIGGTLISAREAGLPTGPLIIVVATALVLISILVAPGRGLIWRWYEARQQRRRFVSEQLLMDMYRIAQSHNTPDYAIPKGMLIGLRGPIAQYGLQQLSERGLVQQLDDQCWQLTDKGFKTADSESRNRRLWQAYRLYQETLGLPLIQENPQTHLADVLPSDAVARLEALANEHD